MTDIERLRELLAKAAFGQLSVSGTGWLMEGKHMVGHGVWGDPAIAIAELVNAAPALLADYERLRGMEERVKGAAVGEFRGCEQSWKAGGSVEVKFRVLDINYHAPMRVALVPVPGGEGK